MGYFSSKSANWPSQDSQNQIEYSSLTNLSCQLIMITINFQQVQFCLSVASLQQLPEDAVLEIGFAGRSNAGKSSAMNTIVGKKMAKTSKTPGRTQLLNFFSLGDHKYLVDMPGYGFAKVSKDKQKTWSNLLEDYFESREVFQALFLIMDIRHPLQNYDKQLLTWAEHVQLPVHILLTKSDKLSKSKANGVLFQLQKQFKGHPNISLQLFSSLKKSGVEQARQKLQDFYEATK